MVTAPPRRPCALATILLLGATGCTSKGDQPANPVDTGPRADSGRDDTGHPDTADSGGDTGTPGEPRLEGDVDLDEVATATVMASGAEDGRYRMVFASVGDVDGDAAADLVALDAYDRVAVLLGPLAAGTVGTESAAGYLDGWLATPGGVGDVTGDGLDDVALAGATWSVYAGPFVGAEDTQEEVASVRDYGMEPSDVTPARVGDLDGDGVDDLAVGSDWPFAVYVFSGPVMGSLDADSADSFPIALGSSRGSTRPGPIGDVDGDGRDDLLACGVRSGTSINYSSYTAIWTGGSATPVWSVTDEPEGYDAAGRAVAADFNGDGAVDVAVGASGRDAGRGQVSVFAGPLAGTASITKADTTIVGRYSDEGLAEEMAAGDLDGDGVDDLVLSSHGDHGGSAWVLYGPVRTGSTSVEQVAARLWNVDGVGLAELDLTADLTGDGRADLLIGSWYPWGDRPQGWVVPGGIEFTGDDLDRDGNVADDCDDADPGVYIGAVEACDSLDQDCDGVADDGCAGPLEIAGADARANVAGEPLHVDAGDVDGDGRDDLVVTDASGVWVHMGATLPTTSAVEDGTSVASVYTTGLVPGDVDGDGHADLAVAVGGDLHVVFDPTHSVYSGDLVVTAGDAVDADPGSARMSRDITGDGAADLVVGYPLTPDDSGWGQIVVFAGPFSTGTLEVADADVRWGGMVEPFGAAPALGDVDGDGVDDLLTGMSYGAYLSLGPWVPGTAVGAEDAGLIAARAGDDAGAAVALGDMDGDGYADLLVGAPGADLPGDRSGALYVFPSPVRGEVELTSAAAVFVGEAEDQVGASLLMHDLDGDGATEVLVGAPAEGAAGRVFVLPALASGVWTPADATLLYTGDSAADSLGGALAPVDGGFAALSNTAIFVFD